LLYGQIINKFYDQKVFIRKKIGNFAALFCAAGQCDLLHSGYKKQKFNSR
jgi:hypothetical protein